MVNLSITIYTCCASFFMFMNKNLKETAFNYYAQWSDVDGQKINFFIISMGVMFHNIKRLPLEGMAYTKRNAQGVSRLYVKDDNFLSLSLILCSSISLNISDSRIITSQWYFRFTVCISKNVDFCVKRIPLNVKYFHLLTKMYPQTVKISLGNISYSN